MDVVKVSMPIEIRKWIEYKIENDFLIYKNSLIEYLRLKAAQEDWHGVADAANDLRDIDAAVSELTTLLKGFP